MAQLKSPVFAGIILIALWAAEIAGGYAIFGESFPAWGIGTLVAIMVLTLFGFIKWNNKK